jgi:Uma2 family endonuclease
VKRKRQTSVVEAAEPTWEIAHLFPPQGAWSEEGYLALPTNHLVEFSDGYIEVLPVPSQSHQWIVLFLVLPGFEVAVDEVWAAARA